jgi:hypothetical protein
MVIYLITVLNGLMKCFSKFVCKANPSFLSKRRLIIAYLLLTVSNFPFTEHAVF